MSIPVGQLTIEMAANVVRLQKDMEAARKVVDSATSRMIAAARSATTALAAIGVTIGATSFAKWIQGAIDTADETSKLAQKAGLATEEVAGLSLAFKQGGVESDVMLKALSKLAVGVADGNEAIKLMGIQTKTAEGNFKSSREILALIAEKFEGYADGVEKTALAVEIFGKSGADLIPVLNGGRQELEKFDKIAQQLGLTVDELTGKRSEKFNDTVQLIGFSFKGVANLVVKEVIPGFEMLATKFFDGATNGNLLRNAATLLAGPIKTLQAVVLGAAVSFDVLGTYMGGYAKAFMEFATGNYGEASKVIEDTGRKVIEIGKQALADFKIIADGAQQVEETTKKTDKVKPPRLADKTTANEYQKIIDKANELVNAIQFETDALTMSNVEKETAIALQKLLNIGIKEGTKEWETYSEAVIFATIEKEQMKKLVDERRKIDEKAIADRLKAEEKFAKEVEQINEQIGQSLTDALMQGGITAKDFLVNMFKTMVLRPMLQPIITGLVGGFTSAALPGVAAAEDGTGGSVGSSMGMISMASNLKSAYSMVTGGFTALGNTVTNFVAESAGYLLNGAEAGSAIQSMGVTLAESASAVGTAASALAGIGAGLAIGNLISDGKGVGGGSSWLTVGGGAAAGAAIGSVVPVVGTALGGAIGGIVGGIANAAFGSGKKKVEDTGIKVMFNSMKTTVQEYEDWSKAGGFISGGGSGQELSQVDAELQKYIDVSVGAVAVSVRQYTDILGLQARDLTQYSQEVQRSLKGLSPEDAKKAIDESIKAYADGLSTFAAAEIAPFQRSGEQFSDTLARLGGSLKTVNDTFGILNITLYDATISGADAASKLADAFGGLDKLVAATDAYYQNFYSAQERADETVENLGKVFNELGLVMPATNAEFRAMVEAARAAGNDALFANLIKLAPAFSNLKNSLTALVDTAFQDLQAAIQREQKAALDSIEKQKSIAQAQKDVADENVKSLGSIFDYLTGQINELTGAVASAQSAAQGMAFIQDAIDAANNTGYLPDQAALETAVSAVRAGIDATNYASSYEQKLAQLRLAGQLDSLKGVAEEQKTTAELQLEVAQQTIDDLNAQAAVTNAFYEEQLIYAQTQINELKNVNGSVLTVAGAMAALGAAIDSAKMQSAASGGGGGGGGGGTDNSRTGQINSLYQEILGRNAEAGGLNAWNGSGLSIDQIREGIMNSAEAQARGYATGGFYPGGLAMVGEQGPELINFNRPGQVYTAGQTAEIMSGNSLAAEIQALRGDLQAQARANVQIQARTAKVLERWESSGLPDTRIEV